METYILLCDRPERRKASIFVADFRLLAGLIGTAVAALLSLSGPHLPSVTPAAQTVATYADPDHRAAQDEGALA